MAFNEIVHYLAHRGGADWTDELDPSDGFRWSIGKRRALVLFAFHYQWHTWFLGKKRPRL